MGLMKQGQGAAKAASELMRTPERQALAAAIEKRNGLSALLDARRKVVSELGDRYNEASSAYYRASDDLENRRRDKDAIQRERTDALLRGEEPPAMTTFEADEARVAELKAAKDRADAEQKQAEADAAEIERIAGYAASTVKDAVTEVIWADPATTAVSEALVPARERYLRLQHALGGALNQSRPGGGYPPHTSVLHQPLTHGSIPPCPWREATQRLHHDPDAAIPMPDAV